MTDTCFSQFWRLDFQTQSARMAAPWQMLSSWLLALSSEGGERALVSLLMRTPVPSWEPHLMTSSNPNYLLQAPPSTYGFGGTHSVIVTYNLPLQKGAFVPIEFFLFVYILACEAGAGVMAMVIWDSSLSGSSAKVSVWGQTRPKQ